MLTLYCGSLGASKTTNAVRTMVKDNSGLPTYTNIRTKNIPKAVFFENKLLIKEEIITSGKREKKKYSFNRDYWLSLPKPMNIVIDEVHFLADSRESQSQMNKAVTEFISMARRIIGMDQYGYGDFIFIAQRPSTIDVRIRDLITNVVYHVLHWILECDNCGLRMKWSSEKPNIKFCPHCHKRSLRKEHFRTEQYYFTSVERMNEWLILGTARGKPYYRRNIITDISDYFNYFDTHQYLKAEKDLSEKDKVDDQRNKKKPKDK